LSIIHEALKKAQSPGPDASSPGSAGGPPAGGRAGPRWSYLLMAVALVVGLVALGRIGYLAFRGWEAGRTASPSRSPSPGLPAAPPPSQTAPVPGTGFTPRIEGAVDAGMPVPEGLYYTGDLAGAEALLRERWRKRGGDDPVTANNLGLVLKSRGAYAEALSLFNLALAARPAFPEALNNRAVLLRRMGRDEAAETDLRTALALAPAFAEAQLDYGVLLESTGRKGEALRLYQAYLANPERIPGMEEALVRQRAVALESELAVTQWTRSPAADLPGAGGR
jgi:hypothetical protein